MPTFVVFGEKTPDESQGAAMRAAIGRIGREYGIVVNQDLEDVAKALDSGGMCRLDRRLSGELLPVYVNPAAVMYIEAYDPPQS